MNQMQMHKLCKDRVNEIVDRMHELCVEGRSDDASALYEEIQDWIVQKTEIEVMSLDYLSSLDI